MGGSLGPTLADIMAALEDALIKPLFRPPTRFVDNTLVLAKPLHIPFILNKLNSFHVRVPTEQFNEVFTDDNNIFSTSKLPLQALLSITNQFIQDNTYTFLRIRPWGPIYKKGPYNTEC